MGLSRITYGISLVGWNKLYEFTGAHLALPEERYYVQVKLGGENTLLDYYWLELVNGNEIAMKPTRVSWRLRRTLTRKKGISDQ